MINQAGKRKIVLFDYVSKAVDTTIEFVSITWDMDDAVP